MPYKPKRGPVCYAIPILELSSVLTKAPHLVYWRSAGEIRNKDAEMRLVSNQFGMLYPIQLVARPSARTTPISP